MNLSSLNTIMLKASYLVHLVWKPVALSTQFLPQMIYDYRQWRSQPDKFLTIVNFFRNGLFSRSINTKIIATVWLASLLTTGYSLNHKYIWYLARSSSRVWYNSFHTSKNGITKGTAKWHPLRHNHTSFLRNVLSFADSLEHTKLVLK